MRTSIRKQWADKMWDVLFEVHPDGMGPKELQLRSGLSGKQVLAAADYVREVFHDHDPPMVYVRRKLIGAEGEVIGPNKWYIAATWASHTRFSVNSEYLLPAFTRLESADQLLQKSERAFPQKSRRIRKIRRNVTYVREELADLIAEID